MFSVITNIYNKKTKGPTLMEFNRMESIAPYLQFPLISSDYAENWPEPVQRNLQHLMGDHLIFACTDTQRQKCELRWKTTFWEKKFLSCSFYLHKFRKYVSYGFPIINVCNPGVHYETPCIRTQCVPRSKHSPPLL
jgi:hypothetical protein